jgi:hypothetical protein
VEAERSDDISVVVILHKELRRLLADVAPE